MKRADLEYRCMFRVWWDDTHKSPFVGPFRTETEMKKEMTAVRRTFREAGMPVPKLEVQYMMRPPGGGLAMAVNHVEDEARRAKQREHAAERSKIIARLPRNLANGRYREFFETLQKGQEVRWLGTKNATYFVTTGEVFAYPPGPRWPYVQQAGAFIELTRKSGKTFWSALGKVRPLDVPTTSQYDGPDFN